MNSLNIESIYLSLTEISESLPCVSAAAPEDNNDLTEQLQHLSIHNGVTSEGATITTNNNDRLNRGRMYLQDDESFNITTNNCNNFYSTTSVKEISNCSASCSHSGINNSIGGNGGGHDGPRSNKRIRPHLFRRIDTSAPRKFLDASSVRKKTPAKQPRQRATSFGSLQLSQGKFGAVCRKMFGQQRRRKSFSISSKGSSLDGDIADDSSIAAGTSDDSQSTNSSNLQQQQKGCGHEATSPDMPDYPIIENGEIDELAEYFEHFVSVHRKMSALAESMYV
jgi:hypothetical protein